MSESPNETVTTQEEETALGTLGWVGAVILLSGVCLTLLSIIGPLGER